MKKTLKTISKVILVLLVSVIFFVGIIAGGVSWWWVARDNKIFSLVKFDRDEWLKARDSNRCIRGAMYSDLINHYLKKDMSKDEVLRLLGEPDHLRIYHRFYGDKKCYEYLMGSCKWFPAPSTLLICYNSKIQISDFFLSDVNDSGEAFELD